MLLIRLRLELCKLLILGGSNCDVQLDQLAVTDRWVEGLAIKPIQVEYVMTQFPRVLGFGGHQNDFRYSAGVLFRLGAK